MPALLAPGLILKKVAAVVPLLLAEEILGISKNKMIVKTIIGFFILNLYLHGL